MCVSGSGSEANGSSRGQSPATGPLHTALHATCVQHPRATGRHKLARQSLPCADGWPGRCRVGHGVETGNSIEWLLLTHCSVEGCARAEATASWHARRCWIEVRYGVLNEWLRHRGTHRDSSPVRSPELVTGGVVAGSMSLRSGSTLPKERTDPPGQDDGSPGNRAPHTPIETRPLHPSTEEPEPDARVTMGPSALASGNAE